MSTHERIADVVTRFEISVPITGPSAGLINADSFADAVIESCGPILREPVVAILTDLIAELQDESSDDVWFRMEVRQAVERAEARLREVTGDE